MRLDIWEFINGVNPIVLIILSLLISYLVYKDIIRVKWLNLKGKNKDNPHMGCLHYNSLNKLVIEIKELKENIKTESKRAAFVQQKIIRLKHFELIYEQLNEASLAWIEIGNILKDNFNSQLLEIDPGESQKVNAIVHYNLIIDKIEEDVLGVLRKWMKRNHLSNKKGADWGKYIDDKTTRLIKLISELIERRYLQSLLLVKHEDLHKSAIACMPKISSIVIRYFNLARDISITKNNLIDLIDNPIGELDEISNRS